MKKLTLSRVQKPQKSQLTERDVRSRLGQGGVFRRSGRTREMLRTCADVSSGTSGPTSPQATRPPSGSHASKTRCSLLDLARARTDDVLAVDVVRNAILPRVGPATPVSPDHLDLAVDHIHADLDQRREGSLMWPSEWNHTSIPASWTF